MKIIIDCSNLQAGGGIQVALSFINDLNVMNEKDEFVIIMSPQIAPSIKKIKLESNFNTIEINKLYHKYILFRGRVIKKIENLYKPDVIFTVFGPSYHKSRFPKVVGFAVGQMLYPKSPYFKKLNYFTFVKLKLTLKLKKFFFINNSDILIFETDDAKNIFSKISGGKIKSYTVSNTLNEVFYNPKRWIYKDINSSNTFNILYITANYTHKNLSIIPGIINHILNQTSIRDFKFILTISKDESRFSDTYDQYIEYIGKVSIDEVPLLYKQADIFFMPSLLEIFSTSYLEAMYMEKPIIASDMSFARDICNDAAIYCEPLSCVDYANAIINLYGDENLRTELIQNGLINLKRFSDSMDRTKSYFEILKKYSYNENTK